MRCELIKMDKYIVSCIKKPSFKDWIEHKNTWNKFESLADSQKRELFLQWKHGLESKGANEALEGEDWEFMIMVNTFKNEDWESLDEGVRDFYRRKIEFIEYVEKVRKSIFEVVNTSDVGIDL